MPTRRKPASLGPIGEADHRDQRHEPRRDSRVSVAVSTRLYPEHRQGGPGPCQGSDRAVPGKCVEEAFSWIKTVGLLTLPAAVYRS